jgi:hypothetical protein
MSKIVRCDNTCEASPPQGLSEDRRKRSRSSLELRGTAGQITGFLFSFWKRVIDPPRGSNHCFSKDRLEKNSSGFFDCAPPGAAAFILSGGIVAATLLLPSE